MHGKKQPGGCFLFYRRWGVNSIALAKKKPGWIDLDAQTATTDDLFNLILRTANGQETQNERHGYREIAIFKDGVTL